jgi:hypothetical protein
MPPYLAIISPPTPRITCVIEQCLRRRARRFDRVVLPKQIIPHRRADQRGRVVEHQHAAPPAPCRFAAPVGIIPDDVVGCPHDRHAVLALNRPGARIAGAAEIVGRMCGVGVRIEQRADGTLDPAWPSAHWLQSV